ncbi:MAG TPA: recombinase RecA, partial [Nitrospiria bacterium]|nr:recombinase RecA [Nitrospiria bacterium]
IIDLEVERGIIEKSGAWYAYKGERIGQGRDNAREYIKENQTIAAEIEEKIREAGGLVKKQDDKKAGHPIKHTVTGKEFIKTL